MACPICGAQAEEGRGGDYGERRQFRCPRCGPFLISRTALRMLRHRIEADPMIQARLSHAVRSNTREDDWLLISSTNLDELATQTLPGPEQQLENLLRWLAAQARDDRLGPVTMPDDASLAAVVGTVDTDRVGRLIHYAARQGLVEGPDQDGRLHLTPEAWARTGQTMANNNDAGRSASAPEAQPRSEILRANCNTCGGERDAFRRAEFSKLDDSQEVVSSRNTYMILECCGCHELSVQRDFWFSEWDDFDTDPLTGEDILVPGVQTTYWPARTTRMRPAWNEALEDDVLRRVFDEVYTALDQGLLVLAAIGTRTLLDRAMFLRVGDPPGGFAGKLSAMVNAGHIGSAERDILEAVTDAGSAAAHRGFVPRIETLSTIIDTVEHFLQREFILRNAAGAVRQATPPRRRP
jgi:hypothetical protein